MSTRGSIIAMGNSATPPTAVDNVTFNLALVSGGDPVDLTPDDPATATAFENVVVISYRDTAQVENQIPWDVAWVGQNDGDNMLEAGELAELTIDLSGLTPALGTTTAFTLEVKPPPGAVFQLNSTTPRRYRTGHGTPLSDAV
jgi:archaellin